MKLELSHSNIQEVFEAIELASEYGLRAEVMTSAIGSFICKARKGF